MALHMQFNFDDLISILSQVRQFYAVFVCFQHFSKTLLKISRPGGIYQKYKHNS